MITYDDTRTTSVADLRVGDVIAFGNSAPRPTTAMTTALVVDKRPYGDGFRVALHHYRTPFTFDWPDAFMVGVEGRDPFFRAGWTYVQTWLSEELTGDDAIEFGLYWSRIAHAEQDRHGQSDHHFTDHAVVRGAVLAWMALQGIDHLQ